MTSYVTNAEMYYPSEVETLVRESNYIEGITRDPTHEELFEYGRFLNLKELTLSDIEQFVSVFEKTARLRHIAGMNVMIGGFSPISGGMQVVYKLEGLINRINDEVLSPFEAHLEYETLHPFTDCNGRSGRMIWTWMMQNLSWGQTSWITRFGFLHSFYYQTLRNSNR